MLNCVAHAHTHTETFIFTQMKPCIFCCCCFIVENLNEILPHKLLCVGIFSPDNYFFFIFYNIKTCYLFLIVITVHKIDALQLFISLCMHISPSFSLIRVLNNNFVQMCTGFFCRYITRSRILGWKDMSILIFDWHFQIVFLKVSQIILSILV